MASDSVEEIHPVESSYTQTKTMQPYLNVAIYTPPTRISSGWH